MSKFNIVTDRHLEALNEDGFLINKDSSFSVNESYKALRTNISFMLSNKPECKIISFTSPSPGEGKTLNCVNISIAMAQTGAKTLIIDADLRRPRVHKYFNTTSFPGLSNRLTGYSESSCICTTNYENLYVLTAGQIPPNPSELLASKNFKQLLDELSQNFDYIFIDAPPINLVTDVAIVSKVIDGVIILARHNSTTIDTLKVAVSSLEKVDANILGFLLNDFRFDSLSYKRRYRYKRSKGYNSYNKYGYNNYNDYYGYKTTEHDKT